MKLTASSSQPHFTNPQYFKKASRAGRWYCDICTSPERINLETLTAQATMRHEASPAHIDMVRDYLLWHPEPDAAAWNTPDASDRLSIRVAEKQRHVDCLKDLIPFWRQQMDAASRGVELRWEKFLEALADEQESSVWETQPPSWAVENMEEKSSYSARAASSEGQDGNQAWRNPSPRPVHSPDSGAEGNIEDRDAYMFVEEIARLKSVSDDRRRRMHAFYKMPTQRKVARIQELIYGLHEPA